MFKLIVLLSTIAYAYAVVSSDGYSGVGIQAEQTVRGGLNTLSSYSKAINTPHSQSFVSRTDYTSNPGLIAHPHPLSIAPVVAAAPYHAPIGAYHGAAYHAPYPAAYPAYHGYGAYKAPLAAAVYH